MVPARARSRLRSLRSVSSSCSASTRRRTRSRYSLCTPQSARSAASFCPQCLTSHPEGWHPDAAGRIGQPRARSNVLPPPRPAPSYACRCRAVHEYSLGVIPRHGLSPSATTYDSADEVMRPRVDYVDPGGGRRGLKDIHLRQGVPALSQWLLRLRHSNPTAPRRTPPGMCAHIAWRALLDHVDPDGSVRKSTTTTWASCGATMASATAWARGASTPACAAATSASSAERCGWLRLQFDCDASSNDSSSLGFLDSITYLPGALFLVLILGLLTQPGLHRSS